MSETPFGDIMNVSQELAINMIAVPTTLRPSPRPRCTSGMELPPAVVVGVEEEGFGEEEQDVREEGRGEHAHQVVRELRIQDDEHERQERAEGRGEREGHREELRELVREPVVSQISGLVADRLDDEREDRDGKDERREQQVELRDRPDGHAASDDGERPVLGLHVGLRLGLASPRRPSRRPVPPRAASGRRSRQGPGKAPCTRGSSASTTILTVAAEHHEAGDGTENEQQLAVHQRRSSRLPRCPSAWRAGGARPWRLPAACAGALARRR